MPSGKKRNVFLITSLHILLAVGLAVLYFYIQWMRDTFVVQNKATMRVALVVLLTSLWISNYSEKAVPATINIISIFICTGGASIYIALLITKTTGTIDWNTPEVHWERVATAALIIVLCLLAAVAEKFNYLSQFILGNLFFMLACLAYYLFIGNYITPESTNKTSGSQWNVLYGQLVFLAISWTVWKMRINEESPNETDLATALYIFQFGVFFFFISTCLYVPDIANSLNSVQLQNSSRPFTI